MAGMFGHAWVSQYGAQPDGIGADTWSAALASLSAQQIAIGLHETLVAGEEWPPSAPRFRLRCFGIPTLAAIRLEFARKDAEHSPFFRLVWDRIDAYKLAHSPMQQADWLIRDAYDLAREHVMRGGLIPPNPVALVEHKPNAPKPADPAVARTYLDKIAAMLKTEPVKPHTEVDNESASAA